MSGQQQIPYLEERKLIKRWSGPWPMLANMAFTLLIFAVTWWVFQDPRGIMRFYTPYVGYNYCRWWLIILIWMAYIFDFWPFRRDWVRSAHPLQKGLVLVTGPAGSGKSTTLAAMVDFLNHHTDGHILTLEDPVEYLYRSERCLIQQREIGQHCPSFVEALRGALREDPDVILLGELRDAETIRLALTAAETGHLVLATLHTWGASQAIDRLVDTFPAQEKDPVRNQLAGSLRAVLAQRLLPDLQGGRVALYELLVNTPAAANLIREGKTWQLPGIIQTGQQAGMQNFDQSVAERRAQGRL